MLSVKLPRQLLPLLRPYLSLCQAVPLKSSTVPRLKGVGKGVSQHRYAAWHPKWQLGASEEDLGGSASVDNIY